MDIHDILNAVYDPINQALRVSTVSGGASSLLLMETGDHLLAETGDRLLLDP